MRKTIKQSIFVGALAILFSGVISCEKDFTDLETNVISNTKFSTDQLTVAITLENGNTIESVLSDNITIEPGEYLLGVLESTEYQTIKASIVSQVSIVTGLELIDADTITKYETGTSHIVTTIDTVFIKLPYHATLDLNTSAYLNYTLDSIIGDQSKAHTLNVYQLGTYLNRLDPAEPSQINSFNSNDQAVFEKIGAPLNDELDFLFRPHYETIGQGTTEEKEVFVDTAIVVNRWASTGVLVTKDTILYSATSTIPYPFARIPLNEDEFKEIFLDKYGSSEFESQDAFNNYFRGIVLEATGNEGTLTSFKFNNTTAALNPSIEVYYTNTVVETATNDTIKTFRANDSFPLSGIRAATYDMGPEIAAVSDQVIVQGTAGSEATVDLFGNVDLNANGVSDKIDALRDEELLINDASLTFYVNQDADMSALPYRLYMYKDNESASTLSQIKDTYSEGSFGGFLELDGDGNPEKYTFKITDYISDILSSETDYSPKLKLKVFNATDLAITDTIFRQYNWSPKAITLFNHATAVEGKKAELKISYSKAK